MDCATCEMMVDVYLDGEMTAAESAQFEQALENCPECRRRLDAAREIQGLLRELPAEPAPDLLRARIERELRAIAADSRPAVQRSRVRWTAMAASLVMAIGLGWLGGTLSSQSSRDTDELVAAYLRVASSEHAVDVVSSDRHTVKPWFAGRIDYSPPVHDLSADGFPLLGGRLDVYDGRKVAVLVYGHGRHKVVLTLWPAASTNGAPADVTQHDGFSMAQWRRDGFEMRAVSDIEPGEMAAFAKAVDRATDADH
jgi:mycothiol system anti-sigma-R factor